MISSSQAMVSSRTTLTLLLLLVTPACDWLWPLEGEHDPHRCDPPCAGGTACRQGQCVSLADGGKPDLPPTTKDGGKKDNGAADAWPGAEPTPAADGPLSPDAKTGCTDGDGTCTGPQTIKHCDKGTWKTENCGKQCQTKGYDYAMGCKTAGSKALCGCATYAAYGTPCSKSILCAPGLLCFVLPVWKLGYCSRACKDKLHCALGSPPMTAPLCNMTLSGQSFCGFSCALGLFLCPPGLVCSKKTQVCEPGASVP